MKTAWISGNPQSPMSGDARSRRDPGRWRRGAWAWRNRQPLGLRTLQAGVYRRPRPAPRPASSYGRCSTPANLAVYDAGMNNRVEGRMLTTLTVSMFRNNEVMIGHVGDCRVYAIQRGRIRRMTSDHSYAGVQLKLGLVTVQEAATSAMRSVLTRTVGQDPMIRLDTQTVVVNRGDYIVQCTDGLWCFVTEAGDFDTVTKTPPKKPAEN